MEGLDILHGREDERRGLAWGHRLMEEFPVLRAKPDGAFIERCFDHFIRLLEFREAEDELAALSATPADQLTDAWAERLFQLKRDIEADRVTLDLVEQELAEMAGKMGDSSRAPTPGRCSCRNRSRRCRPSEGCWLHRPVRPSRLAIARTSDEKP